MDIFRTAAPHSRAPSSASTYYAQPGLSSSEPRFARHCETRHPALLSPEMERRLSFASASAGSNRHVRRVPRLLVLDADPWGSAINYLGNPRFRPRCAWKIAATSSDMEDRKSMLTNQAVLLVDEGMVAVQSNRELADIIQHHFSIYKHEFQVYRSYPEPLIAIFSESYARDRVFCSG